MFTVRRATLEDKGRIFAFVRVAYAATAEYRIPDRWEWEFERNPFRPVNLLPVFIAVDEETGHIIGQSCAMPLRVSVNGEIRQMAWGVDGFVLPQHRGRGVGTALQKILHDTTGNFMSLNTSATNQRIKERLGSVRLPPVLIFDKLLRFRAERVAGRLTDYLAGRREQTRRLAATLIRASAIDRLVTTLLNGRLAWQERGEPIPIGGGLELAPVDQFDAEFDRLWEKLSDSFGAAIVRDASYLRWKFIDQPLMDYATVAARRSDDLVGYVILRQCRSPEPNVGLIVDLFVKRSDEPAIDSLLGFAIAYFRRTGVTNIEAATTIAEYQRALLKRGFVNSGQSVPMFYGGSQTKSVAAGAPLSWLLGRGDSDWDQFPLRTVSTYVTPPETGEQALGARR